MMKIQYKKGNIIHADEFVIAHGCNAQGVMGSAAAKDIRQAFPLAYQKYKEVYDRAGLQLGTIIWVVDKKWIANCITQEFYGRTPKQYVSYDAIRQCMVSLNKTASNEGQKSVALTKIGCGLGGGDWNIISKIIEEEFKDVIPVVYEL